MGRSYRDHGLMVKEALRGALANANWDPLPHKKSRGRRAPTENLALVPQPATATQRRPPTPIPSTTSIPWPTCLMPSPPLTSPSRIAVVDQLPAPDAEGATSQLRPINPTTEITSEGMYFSSLGLKTIFALLLMLTTCIQAEGGKGRRKR